MAAVLLSTGAAVMGVSDGELDGSELGGSEVDGASVVAFGVSVELVLVVPSIDRRCDFV